MCVCAYIHLLFNNTCIEDFVLFCFLFLFFVFFLVRVAGYPWKEKNNNNVFFFFFTNSCYP